MSLGCALALPLLASLAAAADAGLQLDLLAESRTSTVQPEGLSLRSRQALVARPRAALRLDAGPLRLGAAYAATIWTSDVEASPEPLVTQEALVRLENRPARTWRARATAAAARGQTDPFADPVQALPPADLSQSPALASVRFEALSAGLDGTLPVGRRTTIAGEAGAWRSGGAEAADRAALPLQDSAALQLGVTRLLSERNRLRLAASASGSRTETASGDDLSAWATATATWRGRLTRRLDGWAGAGAGVAYEDEPGTDPERRASPVGELGLAWEHPRGAAELSGRAVPFTDRFTGDVALMFQATGALRWRASPRVSFAATASGGALRNGNSALAALDARWTWAARERVALEAGLVGRWQRERASTAPSFAELGVVLALRWESPAPPP